MSRTTNIEWADGTFNPWIGCTKVSAGCANCYAENTTRARVLPSQGHETWGKGAARSRTSAAYWKQPLTWNTAAEIPLKINPHLVAPRVFPSLCDWLDDEVPIEWLVDFLKLIHATPNIDWLLLTKRPESWHRRIYAAMDIATGQATMNTLWLRNWLQGKPPQNIWIGASMENQAMADKRVPALLQIPAAVQFLSIEPMLEAMDLRCPAFNGADSLTALEGLHWVIVGGESGPGARACHIEWIDSIVKQCAAANVPSFVKQLGALSLCDNANLYDFPDQAKLIEHSGVPGFAGCRIKTIDRKGGDIAEFPDQLKVRQFPSAR